MWQIVAKETETPDQFSTTSTVTVLVTDLNDNTPRFLQNSYRFWIRENREVGYGIGQINVSVLGRRPGLKGGISYYPLPAKHDYSYWE